ncbi:MAG: biotin--[acetyl-CoA-carboxylase] ligase [Actinobacteria bacterium]|nr:biotin--[acetyl-CoA-carboxylase] ligase [Actinomycetota bacterium]
MGKKLFCFKIINSTNDHASQLEDRVLKLKKDDNFLKKLNGTVIISEIQSSGRGRNYKKWFSPSGGLWFTLILFLKIKAVDVEKINIIMAVSIYETIRSMFGLKMKIKWPNDIYFEDKKICGILSELNSSSICSFLNIGVGFNTNIDFNKTSPEDTPDTAAISLKEIIKDDINKEKLLACILDYFEVNYENYIKTGDLKTIFLKIGCTICI